MSTTTARKAPEDRKPPKTAGFAFTDREGHWHVLPYASAILESDALTGDDFMDVLNGGDAALIKALYRAADLAPATDRAVRSLGFKGTRSLLARWAQAPDANGVTVGELLAS